MAETNALAYNSAVLIATEEKVLKSRHLNGANTVIGIITAEQSKS